MKNTLRFLKKLTPMLALAAMMMAPMWGWGQGSEDFTNSTATASYADGSFVGNNEITWTYVASRDENGDDNGSGIDGKALMLRRNSDNSAVTSSAISGGIGNFSVKLYKGFTGGGDRQVELFINGISKGTSATFDDFDEHIFEVNGIDISGDIVIEIKNATSKQVIVDDIEWTAYNSGTPVVATPLFTPAGGNYYSTQSVSISTSTPDATIYYTTDGSDPDNTSTEYTIPISVSTNQTFKARAYASGYDPSAIGSATYTFPVINDVANIAALRLGLTDGTIYRLTGEAVLTYQTSVRNAKYIQDATGAILIDDNAGVITTSYDIYDGITGITGTLGLYNGMLQFTPVADPGVATSTGNSITPLEISLAGLTTAHQAMLVKVLNTTITETGNFAASTNYTLTDGSKGTGVLRTAYSDLDYIGTPIPEAPQDMTGVILQFNTDLQLVPRSTTDFVTSVVPWPVTFYVDMTNAPAFTTVEAAGDFNGWAGDAMSLVSDNIYTFTTAAIFDADDVVTFKFRTDGTTWEQDPNRTYTVVAGTNEYHAVWNVMVPAEITFANLQSPASAEIEVGNNFDVYARVYANGLTGVQGDVTNLQAWIGFSSTDTDPANWTNWENASFNQDYGNNEEYTATIGASISEPGVYYYASRFKLGLSEYKYGGFDGGFWDGTNNVSGVLTINATQPSSHVTDFAATANSSSSILVSWADTDASGYLIKGSDVGYESIAPPVDGIAEADDLLVKNIASEVGTHQFTGLTPNTTYYFKIFPYNGSGSVINYKTDGTVPQVEATTESISIPDVIITEVYGGGGNTGATLKNDFIELYNTTSTSIDISGWSIQYYSATGIGNPTEANTFVFPDGKYIPGYSHFLIQAAAGSGGTEDLPLPDATCNIGLSGTNGKVILYTTNESQTITSEIASVIGNEYFKDYVPYGATAVPVWGSAMTSTSNTTSATRKADWVYYVYTQNIGNDFEVIEPTPQNSGIAYYRTKDDGDWNILSIWESSSDNTTWSDAVLLPLEKDNVTINHAVTIPAFMYPGADCHDLTIGTGSLTVKSDGTLITTGTVTGIVTVQREFEVAEEWHMLSSPMVAQSISDDFTPSGTYGDGTGYDFYAWEESSVELPWLNQKVVENYITNFIPGKGYLVAYEVPGTKAFTGTLNSGDVNFTLENSGAKSWTYNTGWNLMGNPYPSGINWHLADRSKFQDEFAYIYAGDSYTVADGNLENSPIGPNQGFFVLAEVASNNQDFTFTNAMRIHDGMLMKATPVDDKFTIRLANENHSDYTTIRYREQSTPQRDRQDALKLFSFNPDVPQVYTRTANEINVAINSIPGNGEVLSIPLSIKVPADGTMTLSLEDVEGDFAGKIIYLHDQQTGINYNLSTNPTYSFTATQGDDDNRFTLSFSSLGINHPEATDGVQVYAHNGVLYVETPSKQVAQLSVYNLTGQLVMQGRTGGNALSTFNASALNTGVYVVNVVLNEGVVSRKVVINK